jgi:hypothetical protein
MPFSGARSQTFVSPNCRISSGIPWSGERSETCVAGNCNTCNFIDFSGERSAILVPGKKRLFSGEEPRFGKILEKLRRRYWHGPLPGWM